MKILFFIFLVGILYAYISVVNHDHFQTFGWDLGFFDQIIWKASKGDFWAYSTIAHENLLADHFQPVLYLLSPLYKIVSDVRMILIAQAFLVVSAAYPLYLLTKSLSRSLIFSFGIVFTYLFFLGTQWTILNEFHQTAFLPLFLSLFYYSFVNKTSWLYWLSIFGIASIKEEYALLVAALGLITWLIYKKKILGITICFSSILFFFFLLNYLMPLLSVKGIYSHYDFGTAGYTPEEIIVNSIKNPQFFFESMISPSIKLKTVFDSFFAFGFLPFLSPLFLIPVIENFATRFIYAGPQFTQWINVNHHAAPLGILLSIASVYSAIFLSKFIKKKYRINTNRTLRFLGLYLISITILQDLILHGPINSLFKPQFYETLDWMRDNYEVIAKVPKDSSVATQNSMLPHISQREEIYLIPEMENAEFLLFDLHDGPNKFSPLNYYEMKEFAQNLLDTHQYSIVFKKGEAVLLKRNPPQ